MALSANNIILLMAICVIFAAKLLIYIELAKFFDCFLHQNKIFQLAVLHQNKIFINWVRGIGKNPY